MSDVNDTTGTGAAPAGGDVAPAGGTVEGGQQAAWYDGLAEDIKANATVTAYGSQDDLIKDFLDLRTAYAVPETADAYGLTTEGLGEIAQHLKLGVDQAKGFEEVFKDFGAAYREAQAESDNALLQQQETAALDYFNKTYGEKAAEMRQGLMDGLKRIVPEEHQQAIGELLANPFVGSHMGFVALAEVIKQRVAPDSFETGSGNGSVNYSDKSDTARAGRMFG